MEFYDKYITRLDTEGNDPELLDELRQEVIRSLREDPAEQALTLAVQIVAAMQKAAKNQKPPEHQMVDAVNCVTDLMIKYLEKMGWRFRAYKTIEGRKFHRASPVYSKV